MTKAFLFDCQTAGVAGDMVVGALVDLGANAEAVKSAMEKAANNLSPTKVEIKQVLRKTIASTRIDVKSNDSGRTYAELKTAIMKADLSEKETNLALKILDTLAEAEACVHKTQKERVHLHEIGSADTVADIVGAVVAANELNLFESQVLSTPVAVGSGIIEIKHGKLSIPTPITLELLKGIPILKGAVEVELATPTGVAILKNFVHAFLTDFPIFKPEKIGYGAGARDFENIPNILRIVSGQLMEQKFFQDTVCVLETNIDNVSGEVISHTLQKLIDAGARDAIAIPCTMKKGRPGLVVKVIADFDKGDSLAEILAKETGTLGI
ncbi:MAG: nickel pincer cofactor biosynthesis protein LarC, partial [Euryarchaeota archaeon]|nr:nickel pincer cofactor biosynthesis protein LarC [Euryarchaeota archaeon]